MRQTTLPEQTAKLIELGFEPRTRIPFEVGNNELGRTFSIGELISFLPLELDGYNRAIVKNSVYYTDNYFDWIKIQFTAHKELIDNLFDACVTLKEEGVI